MSDIPLRPIRGNRSGYTQLQSEEGGDTHELTNFNGTMPSALRAAASYKGKKPIRNADYNYRDDPEEEVTLLSGHEREEAFEEDMEPSPSKYKKPKQRTVSRFLY